MGSFGVWHNLGVSSRYSVLTDIQWQFIAPLTPTSSGKAGRPFNDPRLTAEGIIYRYRSGIPWLLAALLTLAGAAGLITWEVSIDFTVNRAHRHGTATRGQGGDAPMFETSWKR